MKWIRSTGRGAGLAAVLLGLSAASGPVDAGGVSAEANASQARTLQGVWHMQITIRDCATGAALAPPVRSLVTFATGGTLQESVGGGGFAPGQRSDGHGTWRHKGGHTYDQQFVAMINFATPAGPGPGFEAGWIKVQHTVELIGDDQTESAGSNTFYRLDGDVYRTGCSTAIGTRFE
jgi:hypothetical protein